MKCSRCRREAAYFQRYSGLHLCDLHLGGDVEAKARAAIRASGGIRRGDRIAVGLSGSPESITLARFLHRTFAERRDITFLALSVDEGIRGFSRLPAAEQAARTLGMEWIPLPLSDPPSSPAGDTARAMGGEEACTRCRALKQALLGEAARHAGATALALGDTLDDLARRVLVRVLKGEVPWRERGGRGTGLRILVPFGHIPREEILLFGQSIGVEAAGPNCPVKGRGFEAGVGELLDAHAVRHPSSPHALVRAWDSFTADGEMPGRRDGREGYPGRVSGNG